MSIDITKAILGDVGPIELGELQRLAILRVDLVTDTLADDADQPFGIVEPDDVLERSGEVANELAQERVRAVGNISIGKILHGRAILVCGCCPRAYVARRPTVFPAIGGDASSVCAETRMVATRGAPLHVVAVERDVLEAAVDVALRLVVEMR